MPNWRTIHGDPDEIAALAARQHGLVTRQQLQRLGLGRSAISYRCQNGRLFRVHLGVYAVGRLPATPVERAAAAVLACGPGAALSHGSALSLWGFTSGWREPHQVAQIADVLDRFRSNPGRTPLLEALGGLEQPTRSELEDAFLAFCERYGLPRPVVNTYPWRFECDMLFADERVVVELDGWDFHRDKHVFESDRDRDVDLAVIGFLPLRVTWKRLMEEPEREACRFHEILRNRRELFATACSSG